MNRNTAISLIRVCSMVMIILCHYMSFLGISWLAQFLNVGIFVFLLISGYLYADKEIPDVKRWLFGRWLKLCIPIYIWLVIVVIYSALVFRIYPSVKEVILLLTNTQGISWVVFDFPQISNTGTLSGLGSLWFVSVIFLCYLLLLIVKKVDWSRINTRLINVLVIVSFIGLVFLHVSLIYFICFFVGYWIGKSHKTISTKRYIFLTVAMFLAVALRLIARKFLDGTLLYGNTIVGATHTVIAVWFLYTVILMDAKFKFIHKLASSKAIRIVDGLSYFIYITHYFFLQKRFALKDMVPGVFLQFLVFLALAIVTAIIIKIISGLINGRKV